MARDKVIDRLCAAGQDGAWFKTWSVRPVRSVSGRAYNGINRLLLNMSGRGRTWITPNQAKKLGGRFSGVCCEIAVLLKPWTNKEGETGMFWATFNLMPVREVEGLPPELYEAEVDAHNADSAADDKVRSIELICSELYCPIKESEIAGCWKTHIGMPPRESFFSNAEYTLTLAHELAHWIGFDSKPRLPYAVEELVAEMTAVLVCNDLGVEVDWENCGAYVQGWSRAVADRDDAMLKAAAAAMKRAARILGTGGSGT